MPIKRLTFMQNWAGNFTFTAARLHRPTAVEEVQRLVATATKIHAIGTGHSFNGIADSPEAMIDLRGIASNIVIDRERMTVTAGAGTTYIDLSAALQKQGFAIHNLASLPQITVAGAVMTATHGSGDRNEALSSAVSGLDLVVADGSTKHIARGDIDFDGLVVGLGAFGIVTRITLDIQPTFNVRQDSFVDVPWEDVVSNFDAISSAAYSFSIFTKLSSPTVNRLWLKSKVDESSPTNLNIAHLNLKPGMPYALPATVPNPLARLNPFGGIPGPWSDRLAHTNRDSLPAPAEQIQSEYLIARPKFAESVAVLRAMGAQIDACLHAAEIRTIAADKFWLSPAYQQDTIGLHFTWKKEIEAVDDVTKKIEAKLIPLGAKPHWGKLIHADAATLEPLYPRMKDFRSLAIRYDPKGKFRNAYLDRHVFG